MSENVKSNSNTKFKVYDIVWAPFVKNLLWPAIVCNHPFSNFFEYNNLLHVYFIEKLCQNKWISESSLKPYIYTDAYSKNLKLNKQSKLFTSILFANVLLEVRHKRCPFVEGIYECHQMSTFKFNRYDIVWAQMYGHKWWPAIIIEKNPVGLSSESKNNYIFIQFFDQYESRQNIAKQWLRPFTEWHPDYQIKHLDNIFIEAMDQAEEAFSFRKKTRRKRLRFSR